MDLSNFTKDALQRSIDALKEERNKIDAAITMLTKMANIGLAEKEIAPSNNTHPQPEKAKKKDRRSEVSSARLKRVWALARQLEEESKRQEGTNGGPEVRQ